MACGKFSTGLLVGQQWLFFPTFFYPINRLSHLTLQSYHGPLGCCSDTCFTCLACQLNSNCNILSIFKRWIKVCSSKSLKFVILFYNLTLPSSSPQHFPGLSCSFVFMMLFFH
ncbi:hypothetical protein CHARACLAT_019761 [Characodon lateralis]|uniref:Uncharacterized protein n=1 Tax=Characodon lateralis TaxID=208331 RepID=A0ABU7D890_9TELE|nr:hypothetical protein [Characodon lateralis]